MVVFLVVLVLQVCASNSEDSLFFKRNHGFTFDKLPIIPFETHAPAVFEILLPPTLIPTEEEKLNCSENELNCVIRKQMEAMNKGTLLLENEFRETYHNTSKSQRRKLSREKRQWALLAGMAIGAVGYSLFGDDHEDDFAALRAHDDVLEAHIKALESAESSRQNKLAVIARDVQMIAAQDVRNTKIIVEQLNLTEEAARNLYKLQSLTIDHFRFTSFMQDCKLRLFPADIIPLETFRAVYRKVALNAKQNNLELAVPEKNLLTIFSLKVCSCVFSEERALVVVKIPLRRISKKINFLKIIPITYGMNNQICMLDAKFDYAVETDEEIIPVQSRDCKLSDRLCRFGSDFTGTSLICLQSMIQANTLQDLKSCSFRCGSPPVDPVVTTVGSTLYIANAKNVTIRCKGKPDKMVNLPSVGALELNLGNDCVALANDKTFRAKFSSKISEMSIYVTIPGGWSKGLSQLSNEVSIFQNLSDLYDAEWVKKLAVINQTTMPNEPLPEFSDVTPGHLFRYWTNNTLEIISFIWNAAVYGVVIYLFALHVMKKWRPKRSTGLVRFRRR